MEEKQNKIDEIVKFVMNKANGIDDYNWGQDEFEKDLRDKILRLFSQQEKKITEEIEQRRPLQKYKHQNYCFYYKEFPNRDITECDCGQAEYNRALSDILDILAHNK